MELILARIGLFGDYEGRDFTMYLKYRAQLGFGFVNANILLIRNGKHGVEREVNLQMAEEIKADGGSFWWQGDCKPNRTCTVTAILESAMNKEEGQEERLSEHQFS